jgi:hypothetical protein
VASAQTYSAAPTPDTGHDWLAAAKHVPDATSQQFTLPLAGAGQLFWQSESLAQVDGQAVPPPLPLPPPLDDA